MQGVGAVSGVVFVGRHKKGMGERHPGGSNTSDQLDHLLILRIEAEFKALVLRGIISPAPPKTYAIFWYPIPRKTYYNISRARNRIERRQDVTIDEQAVMRIVIRRRPWRCRRGWSIHCNSIFSTGNPHHKAALHHYNIALLSIPLRNMT